MNSLKNLYDLRGSLDMAVSLFESVTEEMAEYDLISMGMLSQNIELARSVVLLFENKAFSSALPLVRSMMEICVDMHLLVANDKYRFYLGAEFFERSKRGLSKNAQYRALRKKRDECYAVYAGEGAKFAEIKIEKKFEAAEVKFDYDDLYSHLCGYTHSGYENLLNKCKEGTESGLDKLKLEKEEPSAAEDHALSLAAHYLLNSGKSAAKLHSEKSLQMFEAYHKSLLENMGR